MKYILFVIFFFGLLSVQCSKNGKGCWMGFSPMGADAFQTPLCDVTKKEAEDKFPQLWFYRYGETKNCYKVTRTNDPNYVYYWWGIPGSLKGKMEQAHAVTLTQIYCSSFCFLRWHKKTKSKITGLFSPTRLYTETLVNADSCSKLYIGRTVTLWETADSISYLELFEKYP